MKISTHHSIEVYLERTIITFFILAALSLLVVYIADPAIYAQSLSLTSSAADRYPLAVTLFLAGVLIAIALLIFGVTRHWRWLFWLLLVAFAGSTLQIPITLLQLTGVLSTADPLWYGLFRMGGGVVELALAVWMIHIYRHNGVWALGKNQRRLSEHTVNS